MTVQQGGVVTPGHAAAWALDGVVEDAGTATEPKLNSLGLYGNDGVPFAITNSAYPWPFGVYATTTIGMGVSQTAAYTTVFGTQGLPYQIIVNGATVLSIGTASIASAVLQASASYANDAAAAAGGVAVGQLYRNGSVIQIRVV